ncbi:MAG TPA: hypothetical protein VFA11_14775 [Acidimicrobiales bacterium]|nr:hypothetical protein [Acidimicrobiales bacterium]
MPIHPARARRLPADVQAALVSDSRLLRPGAVAKTLLHTVPESSVRDRVAANRVPTLLVAGVKEKEFDEPRSFARAAMPHVEVVEAPVGHAVNIQAAEQFNRALEQFFRRAPG